MHDNMLQCLAWADDFNVFAIDMGEITNFILKLGRAGLLPRFEQVQMNSGRAVGGTPHPSPAEPKPKTRNVDRMRKVTGSESMIVCQTDTHPDGRHEEDLRQIAQSTRRRFNGKRPFWLAEVVSLAPAGVPDIGLVCWRRPSDGSGIA